MTPMASAYTLDFEKPLLELERQIDDLKRIGTERQIDIDGELQGLQGKLESLRADIYRELTPLQRVMVARHPPRPYTLDYLSTIFTDFIELHGDRLFRDDPAIVGGRGPPGRGIRHGRRASKGARHQGESQAQLRHAPSGRVPEGTSPDGARREVRSTGHHAHRHTRRIPRAGRGRAGPIGSARAQHPGDGRPGNADRDLRDRGRRLWWRARVGRGRPGPDAGELGVLGELARRLCRHSREGRKPARAGGRGAQAYLRR